MPEPFLPTFGPLLAQTARQWRRSVDERLQPYGLTEATWLPLIRVARSATPMRQKDLAASLSLDSSSVVRLLDNLERANLIERREGDSDRRAKAIFLTRRGRAIVEKVEASASAVRKAALGGLSKVEVETAMRVMKHICGVLAREEHEEEAVA
jgi:MarR family transcriptional regulator for hemolysin